MRRHISMLAIILAGCSSQTGDVVRYECPALRPPDGGMPMCGEPPLMIPDGGVCAPLLTLSSIGCQNGIWESAPWSGAAWIPFPKRVTITLDHSLGHRPWQVITYLSFDRDGTLPATAAGDLARVVRVDASSITLHNDTNGDFFIRVTLQ
jgi:hypothetical protein